MKEGCWALALGVIWALQDHSLEGGPGPPSSEGVQHVPSPGPLTGGLISWECASGSTVDGRKAGSPPDTMIQRRSRRHAGPILRCIRRKLRRETRFQSQLDPGCESALQVAMAFVSLPTPALGRCHSWKCPRVWGRRSERAGHPGGCFLSTAE